MKTKLTTATIKKIARANGIDFSVFSIGRGRKTQDFYIDVLPPFHVGAAKWDTEYSRIMAAYNATVENLIEAVEKATGLKFAESMSGWRGAKSGYHAAYEYSPY